MVQESTIICVDNSEYMRNGDFSPNRMQAQQDAANLILQCKLRANPENAVGILSMGGKVEVLATLTQDSNKLFMKLHQLQIRSTSNFVSGLRVAHLALKHRQNRNHKTRIVVFVGSPLEGVEPSDLVSLAKRFKKEKVQVDTVCFGEADSQNSDKLTSFVDTLNGKDGTGSHLIVVPAGSPLTEALMTSPVCRGEDGAAPPVSVAGGGGGGFEFGIDPSEDPELAMALRVSLEEQRQRQEQEGRRALEESAAAQPDDSIPTPMESSAADVNVDAMTEEEQLAMALQMSLREEGGEVSAAPMEVEAISSDQAEAASGSRGEPLPEAGGAEEEANDQFGQLISDPAALQELISSLPGVDPNSEEIKRAVAETVQQAKEKKEKSKSGKETDKKKDSSEKQ